MSMIRCILAAVAVLASASVAAQERTTSGDQLLQSLDRCRAAGEAAQRLACYEAATDAMKAAVRSGDIRIVDRADVRQARRSLFGFALPRIGLLGNDRNEPFTQIDSTVASARGLANDRVELTLDGEDGAVWRTTDPMYFVPKSGTSVRIRKGALGNYFMSVGGESVRGMRVR